MIISDLVVGIKYNWKPSQSQIPTGAASFTSRTMQLWAYLILLMEWLRGVYNEWLKKIPDSIGDWLYEGEIKFIWEEDNLPMSIRLSDDANAQTLFANLLIPWRWLIIPKDKNTEKWTEINYNVSNILYTQLHISIVYCKNSCGNKIMFIICIFTLLLLYSL